MSVLEAGWRGDHSFSSSAAVFGFEEIIKPEVTVQHPSWSPEQIHREAITLFNLRLSENLGRYFQEKRNENGQTRWEVEEVEGIQQFVVADGQFKGQTLNALWEHTRVYANQQHKPAAYNQAEHHAQLSMQKAFIEGKAVSAVSILSHPDDVKFVQVWNREKDGAITTNNVDLQTIAGRHLTHEEGETFMRKLIERNKGSALPTSDITSYKHLMVRDKQIGMSEIKTISQAHVLISPSIELRSNRFVQKDTQYIPPIQEMAVAVRDNFRRKPQSYEAYRPVIDKKKTPGLTERIIDGGISIGKRVAADSVAAIGMTVARIGESLQKGRVHSKEKPWRYTFQKEPSLKIDNKKKHGNKKEQKNTSRILFSHEHDAKRVEAKEKVRRTKIKEQIVALSFIPVAAEFGLGLPLLTVLAQELPKKESKIGKKQKRAKEKKNILIKSERTHKMIAKKEKKAKKKLVMKERHTSKKEVKKKRRMFRIVSRSDYMRPSIEKQKMRSEGVKRPDKRKKQKKINLTENPKRQHKEKQLIRVLSKLLQKRKPEFRKLRRERRQELREKRNITKQELPRRRKKEIVVQFAFSWVFLLLLKPLRFDVSIHRNKEHKGRKQESTQWILLSIIWHLAMIREAGKPPKRQDFRKSAKGGSASGGKKTKKRTTRCKQIPMQAVIFAYIS